MKSTALIGYTGFVGKHLAEQMSFQSFYNSKNFEDIRGRSFDLVVCSAVRAEKWWANQNPQEDAAGIEKLRRALDQVQAKEAVLISTIDVFQSPRGVDEKTEPVRDGLHPYGKNRLEFEDFFRKKFRTLVVRLPGLFGTGLKKNAIFDLIHGNQIEKINPASAFQFYDLTDLWSDIEKARANQLPLIHLATEPVTMQRVAKEAFGRELTPGKENAPAAFYDFRTQHSRLWNRNDGYIQSGDEVMRRMVRFVG